MTDTDKSGRAARWLRRFARGIGSPFAGLVVISGLAHAIQGISDREPVTAEGVMVAVLFSGGVIGVLIAWWRERIGGLVLVVDAIALAVLIYVTAGHNRLGAALLIPSPLLVSGILFLMSWQRSVRPAES
jgi:succinate dehydrogenase hydrophobic anchor subunit